MEKENPGRYSSTRLTPAEQQEPVLVFQQLGDCYRLPELKEQLQEWLNAVLQDNTVPFHHEIKRNNLVFLFENVERMAEAAYLLKDKSI